MLVALLFWTYAQRITSSWRIEAACWPDVAFRVICAQVVPDHVTMRLGSGPGRRGPATGRRKRRWSWRR
jgi:hypothetical protein